MRISFLGHALRAGGGVSVGRNLIAALGRVAPEERYLFAIPMDLGFEEVCESFPFSEVVQFRHEHLLQRAYFDLKVLPAKVRAFAPDCVFGLANAGLRGRRECVQGILVHNAYLACGHSLGSARLGLLERAQVALQRLQLRNDLRRTAVLACQTRVLLERVVDTYGFSGTTCLLPNGLSQFLKTTGRPVEQPAAFRSQKKQLKLLYVTRYYPHKNIEAIVDMFVRFRSSLKGVVVVITIDRSQHRRAGQVLRRIRDEGLERVIVNVGAIAQEDLRRYYQHADGLLMPTLLESFSGTYLEAMSFGVPILTSDLDFAREVCCAAAQYFDPGCVTSMKDAIVAVRDSNSLRTRLAEEGKRRVQNCTTTWDTIARRLVTSIRAAVLDEERRAMLHRDRPPRSRRRTRR